MGVLNILTDEFLASLPDDDPEASFTMIVKRCEKYLELELTKVDTSESSSWRAYESEEYTAMRTIISAAQRLDIAPFKDMTVPNRSNFSSTKFDEFKYDLDHYLTQYVLDKAIREKKGSVPVPPHLKDRLRAHIHAMRSYLDKADIPDKKRASLQAKLSEFEGCLEADRVPLFKVIRVLIEVLSISANVAGLLDSKVMAKLTGNIIEVVAQAKGIDDENRHPAPVSNQIWIALPPKRQEDSQRESFPADMDDEIPF